MKQLQLKTALNMEMLPLYLPKAAVRPKKLWSGPVPEWLE